MTDPSPTAREQIAETVATWVAAPARPNAWDVQYAEDLADVLVPLVDRLRAEAAAEALRDAAVALGEHNQDIEVALGGSAYVRLWLRDRAAALRGEPCPVYSHGSDGWHCAVTGPHHEHSNAAGTAHWGHAPAT